MSLCSTARKKRKYNGLWNWNIFLLKIIRLNFIDSSSLNEWVNNFKSIYAHPINCLNFSLIDLLLSILALNWELLLNEIANLLLMHARHFFHIICESQSEISSTVAWMLVMQLHFLKFLILINARAIKAFKGCVEQQSMLIMVKYLLQGWIIRISYESISNVKMKIF